MSNLTIKLTVLMFSAWTICTLPKLANAQKSGQGVIDVHAHLYPGSGLKFENSIANAISSMDRFGIATSILMSPPRPKKIDQNYDIADFKRALGKYPGRFVYLGGGGTLNPMLHNHANVATVGEELKEAFVKQANGLIDSGSKGFGEMGSLHVSLAMQHGYSFVPADHPLLLLLADIAAKRNVPIDLHMDAVNKDMRVPKRLRSYPNNPERFPATIKALERLLSHNRKAKIIWAHGGTDHLGDFSAKRVRRMMDKNKNLYISLKIVGPKAPTKNKILRSRRSIDKSWLSLLKRHSTRFVIGTDAFYADANALGPGAEFSRTNSGRLQATEMFLSLLPSSLRNKIGRDNAIKLFRLSKDEAPPLKVSAVQKPKPVSGTTGGLCRDGNMSHCRTMCNRGVKPACNRLKRGW